ncbi:MAG: protein kinase, partial [Myxococcota bacterium]
MADGAFVPFRLGRYDVLIPLGKGGMAEVFLAEQRGVAGFARLVTIKRIRTNLCDDEMYIKMFVDEANLMVNIHHPNVVQVMELSEEGKDLYMVLEYVDGCDLAHALKKRRDPFEPLPLRLGLYVMWSLLRGLTQAHEARSPTGEPLGLIHRDVTPGNVLINRAGMVKLADFGVAKAAGRLTQTAAGQIKGKLGYMAPETLTVADVDQRSDIFSAGALFWEVLVGKALFPGPSPAAVMKAIVEEPIPPPSTVRDDVPADVDRVVMHALEKDPARRPQSVRELEAAVFPLLGGAQPDALAQELGAWLQANVPLRAPSEIAVLPRPGGGTPDSFGFGKPVSVPGAPAFGKPVSVPGAPAFGRPTSVVEAPSFGTPRSVAGVPPTGEGPEGGRTLRLGAVPAPPPSSSEGHTPPPSAVRPAQMDATLFDPRAPSLSVATPPPPAAPAKPAAPPPDDDFFSV